MNRGSDIHRDAMMLKGALRKEGYDWWWHSFTAHEEKTGEEKGFYVEFFLCNPALSKDTPSFGQTFGKKEDRPSYLMVNVGSWGENARQLHRFFSWKEVRANESVPFSVEAEDCCLDEKATKGHVLVTSEDQKAHPEWLSDAGEMSWDLKIAKKIPFNVGYGASKPLRDAEAFQMYWHAEGMKTLYAGTIILDGRKYLVSPETSYGYADKNWGRDFTTPWLWLASSHLLSKKTGKELLNSAFDIGGGRPKIGNIALERKLLGCFNLEGKEYQFNFSKFWTHTKTVFSFKETDTEAVWHVEQETLKAKMVTDITCQKKDMILIRYEAPDGLMPHQHLLNGGNGKGTVKLFRKTLKGYELIDEFLALNVGCEYGEYAEKK
jgi:tocopherol cyclase